jgi:hypothetical protein
VKNKAGLHHHHRCFVPAESPCPCQKGLLQRVVVRHTCEIRHGDCVAEGIVIGKVLVTRTKHLRDQQGTNYAIICYFLAPGLCRRQCP